MTSIWDYEPDIDAPKADPVTGRLINPEDAGGGSLSLGVFAQLAVNLGNLCGQMKRDQDRRDQAARSLPGDYQYATSAAFPASGTLALNLGSPDQGQFWSVRRIVVGGSDITTTPAGTAWVFVQGSPPNANGANPSTAQVADFTVGTLPQKAFYGTHELVVDATEYLWVIITGGTATTLYVASVKAEVFDMSARIDAVG